MTRQPKNREASEPLPRTLDPTVLPDHIDALYRAAWALCGSHHEAEDLVQDTLAGVLRRPSTVPLLETDSNNRAEVAGIFDARELMAAIAGTPKPYRDAVVAVDLVGLSYRQAARNLRTREATFASRLHRGRQHIARALGEPVSASRTAG